MTACHCWTWGTFEKGFGENELRIRGVVAVCYRYSHQLKALTLSVRLISMAVIKAHIRFFQPVFNRKLVLVESSLEFHLRSLGGGFPKSFRMSQKSKVKSQDGTLHKSPQKETLGCDGWVNTKVGEATKTQLGDLAVSFWRPGRVFGFRGLFVFVGPKLAAQLAAQGLLRILARWQGGDSEEDRGCGCVAWLLDLEISDFDIIRNVQQTN